MVVAGQPKTNAEYIQATSRVGRDNPGLVFMVYNPSRSRDKSHYEQFLRYHSALYRYVEATSLTPFSDRARDRGLQALFVTLCRYLCPDLLNNENAANFNPDSEGVKRVEGIICKYVQEVDPLELNNVIRELKDIENKWAIEANGELYYKGKNKKSLLKPDIEEDDTGGLSSIVIECTSCGKKRSMEGCMSKEALKGYRCRGCRPWIGSGKEAYDPEKCVAQMRTLQRGAANVYFSVTQSALTIPPWSKKIQSNIEDKWEELKGFWDVCGHNEDSFSQAIGILLKSQLEISRKRAIFG